MAINPASYNKATKIIQEAILEWERAMSAKHQLAGHGEAPIIVNSPLNWIQLEIHIYNKLKENHYIRSDEEAAEEAEYFKNLTPLTKRTT